ncbi:transglutaminase-like domain-containing protein, partial [Endozoicomonas sp. SESOKO3]
VPVFIAFCRYFGIPCRQIANRTHAFAECSADGGQTWMSVDLGGAPVEATEILPDFQPTRKVSASGTESRQSRQLLSDVLKGADLAQQQALAKACGMSFEGLKKTLETNGALPKINLSTLEIVRNLWQRLDLPGFSVGVSMLLEIETLSEDEKTLIGDLPPNVKCCYKPMSLALREILPNSDANQVIELLKSLHSKMVVQSGASPQQWLSSMLYILKYSNLAEPSVIRFAHEALTSGWLDPQPMYESYIADALQHHELLMRLKDVDELEVEAAHSLKKWYQALLSGEKNSQEWRLAYKVIQEKEVGAFFVTHCHEGFSPFFEENIANPSLKDVWTDQPEGVPNIERMLVRHPAFAKLNSAKANHRPVIILGKPFWENTLINKKVEALYQLKVEKSPNLKQLLARYRESRATENQRNRELNALTRHISDLKKNNRQKRSYYRRHNQDASLDRLFRAEEKEYEEQKRAIDEKYRPILRACELSPEDRDLFSNLKTKCKQAILQAFSHYLYGLTHSKGGRLTLCWANATTGFNHHSNNYGAHDPSSPEELSAMMSEINRSWCFEGSLRKTYLKQALKASDALVLKSAELTTIAEEFLSSVNLNSLSDSLDK